MEPSKIPWPRYYQTTIESILLLGGPLGTAVVIGLLHSALRHGRIEWTAFLGGSGLVAILLNRRLVAGTFGNGLIWLWWCMRVGRVITWQQLPRKIGADHSRFTVWTKHAFSGNGSFGTYTILGGWPSHVLENKQQSKLWVILGKPPSDIQKAYGIQVLSVAGRP